MFKVLPFEPMPLSWWYSQWVGEKIDMDPPYQRKADIWGKWKKAHLIDSILNGFDIPKFYVAGSLTSSLEMMNPHSRQYAVIDGKQRFGAIFAFYRNEIPLNASFIFEEDPQISIAGKTYVEIKREFPHVAHRLDSFIPAVMNVITDDQHKIDELFVRLNSGEAATGSERRNAKQGPVPAILRELVLHPFFQRNVRFTKLRMQEFNLAAKLLLIETLGRFTDTKSRNLDDFADSGWRWEQEHQGKRNTPDDPFAAARDRVIEVLDRLTEEFLPRDPLLASQGNIPVYYWVAREHPRKVNELHDFLEDFTAAVKQAFNEQRDDPASADPELVHYYTMGRTTNDQASLEGRYKILMRRFGSYRDPHAIGRRRR